MNDELLKWSAKITEKFGILPARKLSYRQQMNLILWGQTRRPRSAKEVRRIANDENNRRARLINKQKNARKN